MLTEEEFRLFRNLIHEESGIYLKETKKDFLEHRVAKRMTETRMTSPYWYYKLITDGRKDELTTLLDLMTVNETSFFRNRPQLELFRQVALPDLWCTRPGSGDLLRIWSAGCSTGEEPYTLAMIVREAPACTAARDARIFASDLSLSVLQTAHRGEYPAEKVLATVDDPYLTRYFTRNGPVMQVSEGIRKMVTFDFHNLMNDNGLRDLDAIFCRNVMIYFDMKQQKLLVDRFCRCLRPGGYLFIGHAESIQGWNMGMQFVYHNAGTAYKKTISEAS